MEPLIFLLFALAVVVVAVVHFHLQQKRHEEWATVAFQLAFEYAHEDPFGLVHLPLSLFGKGDGRGIENVAWGRFKGLEVKAFDYWYYEESTDSKGNTSRTYHRFLCVLTEIDAACPHLRLSPESVLSRLADHVGFRDIEFESEEFNRRFQVKAGDRKFAMDLIDPRMMDWLLYTGDDYSFEVLERWVLCHRRKTRVAALHAMLGVVQGFHGRVPNVVRELYGTR